MHEFIESSGDVIAVRLAGSVTGDDLETIVDCLERAMGDHEKLNVFVETHAIDSLQLSALPHHISRTLPLFGKLARFGRVAVVADQGWMRMAMRLESAMLPSVSFRVFEPEQRDEALAWVNGI